MSHIIEANYIEFIRATFECHPDSLDKEQELQLKMAFFGGAVVVTETITNEIIKNNPSKVVQKVSELDAELFRFGKSIEDIALKKVNGIIGKPLKENNK